MDLVTREVVRCWLGRLAMVEAPLHVRIQVHFLWPFWRISGELPLWGPWIGFN